MIQSYPSYSCPDPSNIHPEIVIHPRPLKPIQDPVLPENLPSLPSHIRNASFNSSYTLTTHLYPSAHPRAPSLPFPRESYAEVPDETKEARLERQKALVHKLTARNAAHVKGEISSEPMEKHPRCHWNVVNRFVKKGPEGREGGLTLFLAHANGFPKEVWEPTLLDIFSTAERAGVVIGEVWAFESVQHGDSALLNKNVIGDIFDWADNARDILNFLMYYLPSKISSGMLPTHIPRLPNKIASQRQISGYNDRTLIGIGHSLGGCSMHVHSASFSLAYPALFASLILVEPVITPIWIHDPDTPPHRAFLAMQRRSTWRSREEVLAGFRKSPFWSAWDPSTLEKYVQYGLERDPEADSSDAVRLKMSGAQEAIVFIDRNVSYETWQLLPKLDERIELFFIVSGKDSAAYVILGGERAARELVWRRPHNTSNILVPSAGHLVSRCNIHTSCQANLVILQIPQEVPHEFGKFLLYIHVPLIYLASISSSSGCGVFKKQVWKATRNESCVVA
ncbi:hypothetical protein K439DRAFT_1358320 [Ramaria rubella]|nr:hypothetical protein K439DRAFT_1358320 [Ramaria rubella]